MWDTNEEEIVEPFRVTPGFIAFVAAMFLPVFVALFIYVGAWAVSSQVYAAEAAQQESVQGTRFADSQVLNADEDVAGWKKALVGLCPLH